MNNSVIDETIRAYGTREAMPEGVTGWLGIPYASADRLQPPSLISPWKPRHARSYGPSPIQTDRPWTLQRIGEKEGEELNLCVYSPDWIDTDKSLPVIVWIYGGGFENGANSIPTISGAHLARSSQAVVVSINHRVGAFGFCNLDHYGESLAYATNLGIQDVLTALKWVHENISLFGGAPDRVTVMGQSSGAFIATSLLAAPAAGLFHQLIAVSGPASRIAPLNSARELGSRLLVELGIEDHPARILDIEASRILAAQAQILGKDIGVRNAPIPHAFAVVDDSLAPHAVLSQHPMCALENGVTGDIRMMFLATYDEVSEFRAQDPVRFEPENIEKIDDELQSWGIEPKQREILLAHYEADTSNLGDLREKLLTDWIYRLPTARSAGAAACIGRESYLGCFGRVGGAKAGHSDVVPSLLGIPEQQESVRNALLKRAVSTFVHGGKPWTPVSATHTSQGADYSEGVIWNAELFGEPLCHFSDEVEKMLKAWVNIRRP